MRVGEKYVFDDETDEEGGRVDLPVNIQLVKYISNIDDSIHKDIERVGPYRGEGYFVKYWYEQDGEIKDTFVALYDNNKVRKCEMFIARRDILQHYKKVS